jgi:hypothetical protein
VDVPAPACAVELGFAGEVVAESPDELPEPLGEQPATPSPTAKTQSVTDMDVQNRMEFLRDRRLWMVRQATACPASTLYKTDASHVRLGDIGLRRITLMPLGPAGR